MKYTENRDTANASTTQNSSQKKIKLEDINLLEMHFDTAAAHGFSHLN